MTSINDLSDKPKYTIKKVSDLTGILPVTLRAWERRYSVLSPERKENRYRLYSERGVAIVKWLNSDTPHALKCGGFLGHARRNRPRYLPTGLSVPVL